jgi:hypothetical protein
VDQLADEAADSDDGEWEDDETLDLGLGTTKLELMSYGQDSPYATRQRDNETQAYLLTFFQQAAQKPGFNELFAAMTPEEQDKLKSFG